jgi:predicted tellurium resistance membrane protein TerC
MDFIFAFITLTFLEIVLGVDNIIFISLITNKLPKHQQKKSRFIGLFFAMLFRVGLLITITWLIHHLTTPFFPLEGYSKDDIMHSLNGIDSEVGFLEKLKLTFHGIGVREVILFSGGIFLLGKSVSEIHHKIAGAAKELGEKKDFSLVKAVIQIILIDIVFSFDSILTAVGITDKLLAMILAVVVSMAIMLLFSNKIADYINEKPTLEMLALSFLILIGFMLILEGVLIEVPKAYVYFAVFFSLIVEFLNLRLRKRVNPIQLNRTVVDELDEKSKSIEKDLSTLNIPNHHNS